MKVCFCVALKSVKLKTVTSLKALWCLSTFSFRVGLPCSSPFIPSADGMCPLQSLGAECRKWPFLWRTSLQGSAGGSVWLVTGCSFWYSVVKIRTNQVLSLGQSNRSHGQPPSTIKSSMIGSLLLLTVWFCCKIKWIHFWSTSAQQVCLECSSWLCTCPSNVSCVVTLSFHSVVNVQVKTCPRKCFWVVWIGSVF